MMQTFRTASSVLRTRSIKSSTNNLLKKFSSFSPQLKSKRRNADENPVEDAEPIETEKQIPKMKTEPANNYQQTSSIPVPILTPSIFNPAETVTTAQATKIRSKQIAQQYLQVLMSLQPGNPILYCEALLMLHKMSKYDLVEQKTTGKEVTIRHMLNSALKMTPNFVSDMLLPKAKQLYDSTNYDDAGVLCEWILELQKKDEFLEHSFSNQMSILEAAYIKCNILMKADEYDQAYKVNNEAIDFCEKMFPTSIADARRLHTAMADIFHMKGKLLIHFQKYSTALEALSMSLGLKPKNVAVLYERAYCLLYMGRKKESLEQLDAILLINPDHTEALYLKGMILRDFEQYQESAIQFDKVARNFLKNRPMQSRHEEEDEEELYPAEFIDEFGYFDVWDPLRLQSTAFLPQESKFYIPTLSEVRDCPSIVYPLIERAISSLFVSSKDALDTLRPIIALKEKKFSMIVEASLYEQMKFAEKKIQMRFANVALKLFPRNAKAMYLKAQLFHSTRHYREAVDLFEQVAAIAPETPGPNLFIASCYNYINEFKKANAAVDMELLYLKQKAEDEDPEFMLESYSKHYSMTCSLKAEILYSLGKKAEALKYTTKALEYDFDNITLIRQKANLLVELKHYNEALKFSEHLIRLDPAEGLRLKASIYFTLGRFGAALKFMDSAIEKNPNDIAGLIDKGVMLFDMKRYAEAYGCFNKVISLDPKASIAYQLRQKTLEFAPEALKRTLPAHEF